MRAQRLASFISRALFLCNVLEVSGQRFDTCDSLRSAHTLFKEKHNYFNRPGNRATESKAITEFGAPDDREKTAAGLRIVYIAETCSAALIFDSDGYFYSGAFREDSAGAIDRNLIMYERYRALSTKIEAAERHLSGIRSELPQFEIFFRSAMKLSPQEALSFVNFPVDGDAQLLGNKLPEAVTAYSAEVATDPSNDWFVGRRGMAPPSRSLPRRAG